MESPDQRRAAGIIDARGREPAALQEVRVAVAAG